MDFQITILGVNSAIPAHGRNQTSQYVAFGRISFLVDCGEGTQHQLRRYKVKSSRIDHIFISHLHGDHYLGLMGLISTFHLNNRSRPLHIYGPRGLDEIITTQLRCSHTFLKFPLYFKETSQDGKNLLLELENVRVFSFPLKHRIACTGFSFEEKMRPRKLIKEKIVEAKLNITSIHQLLQGRDVYDDSGKVRYSQEEFCHSPIAPRRYAFCSDTIFDMDLIPYISGADLLYHEATFMETEADRAISTMHSTARQAGRIAREADIKELLIGHYSGRYIDLQPLLLEARDEFENTKLSEEGETYTIQ
ncbi:MAG TPA: ribonuclease Z [Lunatimonas sp.]|nr:ribonuclease Z [Lunatimonas sp.]